MKLKHVQAAVGKTIEPSQRLIRPSQSILYDTQEGMISVLSPNVQECVSHFLMEWRKVSKMVVIAREGMFELHLTRYVLIHGGPVSQLADKHKWTDVQLQSFDLQTAEFTYYSVSCVSLRLLSFVPDRFGRIMRYPLAVERKLSHLPNQYTAWSSLVSVPHLDYLNPSHPPLLTTWKWIP